jgi:hypothetical protein
MLNDMDNAGNKLETASVLRDRDVEAWDDAEPKDTWRNYSATGRLAVVFAGVTFCVVFFPAMGTRWGLPVAALSAYSVLVFSWVFRDKNCSLSRPIVQEQIPRFLLVHVPFLLFVYWIVTEWIERKSMMPGWLTMRGRKGSLYEWILIASLCLLAWGQQRWMLAIVRSRLAEGDERD